MSRYYSQNPEEEIRHDWITGGEETPVETREFSPAQQEIIQHIIAAAQEEEGEECDHRFNDGRSAMREVMQGTAQECVICNHFIGNWEV